MRVPRWLLISALVVGSLPFVVFLAIGIAKDRDFVSFARSLVRTRALDPNPVPLERAPFADAVFTGKLAHTEIEEASGLAPSRRREDVLWTLNDSGNAPALFALDPRGRDLGRVPLAVPNVDFEDLVNRLNRFHREERQAIEKWSENCRATGA